MGILHLLHSRDLFMSSEFICLRLRFAKDCAKLTKHSAVFAPNFNQNASKKLSKPGEAWRCSTTGFQESIGIEAGRRENATITTTTTKDRVGLNRAPPSYKRIASMAPICFFQRGQGGQKSIQTFIIFDASGGRLLDHFCG